MTVEGLGGDRAPDQLGGQSTPLAVSAILGLCDGVLKEIGRRSHLFAWLSAPGCGSEGWLVVDAYYPGNRLVVVCRDERSEFEQLYAELVPQHGLRLLRLVPSSLGDDQTEVKLELTRLIDDLPPRGESFGPARTATPRTARATDPHDADGVAREGPMARVAASFAQAAAPPVSRHPRLGPSQAAAAERAARFVETRKLESSRAVPGPRPAARPPARPGPPVARRPVARAPVMRGPVLASARGRPNSPPAAESGTSVLLVGLALAVVLCAEVYLGIGKLGLLAGQLLLAFGLALDACARALGTIAAVRARSTGWAWWCAIGGSPAVADFAFFQPEGPNPTDPAPLAGLLSMLALVVIVIALAISAL